MMTSDSTRLQATKRPPFIIRAFRTLWRLVTDRAYRNVMWAVWFRPKAVFQPFNLTRPNRYPRISRFVQSSLGADSEVRILSFGCSTGDEVFSLRQYFPRATIKGIDVNPTVADFNCCLKPGGFLVIVHSNFRFGDTATSAAFEPVLKRRPSAETPLFGSDNVRLPDPSGNVDVVFRKRG